MAKQANQNQAKLDRIKDNKVKAGAQAWLILLLSLIIAFIIYGQTYNYTFVLDDQIVISENKFVQKGFNGIQDILTTESFVGYFGEQKDLIPGARYRPLSIVTFAVEYGLVGHYDARISHLINAFLYGICGFLLWIFLRLLYPNSKRIWTSIACLATLLWMVHPVHTEVVANIKGRDEIMSLIFSLLCTIWSVHYIRQGSKKFLYLIGIALSFMLGLLSKENAITFLAIIPACVYFFGEINKKRLWTVLLLLIAVFAGYLGIRYNAVGYLLGNMEVTDIMNNPFVGMGFMERMSMIFLVLIKYLGLLVVPYPLTHDYYPHQIPRVGWDNIWVILSLLVHIGLAAWMIMKSIKTKKASWAFWIFFYIASLSIYSNIVINVGTTMNERFLFVPTIASCVLLVLLFRFLEEKYLPKINLALIAIGLISLIFGIQSFFRTQVWENPMTLNSAAVKVSTNSARSNNFMAVTLMRKAIDTQDITEKKALLTQAVPYADKAIQLIPEYGTGNSVMLGIAAEFYKLDQDLPKFLKKMKIAAVNAPQTKFIHEYIDYLQGRSIDQNQLYSFLIDVGYNGLSVNKKNHEWGLKYLNYAYNMSSNDPYVNFLISKVYASKGDHSQAQSFRNRAISLDPSYRNKQ